jgi:alginate O-acetyltransferase complex protein AlgI
MLFNSIEFALFLPIVFSLYWIIGHKNIKKQNLLIIVASYFFYGWWDWRFLSLIIVSSSADFLIGLALIKRNDLNSRKILLVVSIIINLGVLGFFKYCNFFIDSFQRVFTFFGSNVSGYSLNIILPVGISFYTFQTLSYTIDIYRRKTLPTRDPIAFFAFVSFFPQLVAGPIERAANLLPQFLGKREFIYDNAVDGMRQVLWGLFKKIVIADNCAFYINGVFANYSENSGSTLLLAAVLFSLQIYGDFSGYSDIAIGTSRLFGFNLKQNFAFPYFSRNIAEFWRRWHISLSSWFKDYLYIPLGGSIGGTLMKTRNVYIIFIVSGFWHGANWTFIAWGFLNACYLLPSFFSNQNRRYLNVVAEGHRFPTIIEFVQMLFTFVLITIAWVFFRSETIIDGIRYLYCLISKDLLVCPKLSDELIILLILIFIFILCEWMQRDKQHALQFDGLNTSRIFRWPVYLAIMLSLFWFKGNQQDFIYFQF